MTHGGRDGDDAGGLGDEPGGMPVLGLILDEVEDLKV
jgi:hypothetical protein